MSWFDVTGGHLRFSGRITREPVHAWMMSEEGAAAIQAAAREVRFSLLGRRRSARRQVHRALWKAVSASTLRETLAAECDRYLGAWTQLAYAPSLPRLNLTSRRLVIVPRVMILGRTASGITERVSGALQAADVPDPFRAFLPRWLLGRMDDAIRRVRPCPARPVFAHESWACVALDHDFIWVDSLWSGPDWRGHVVMFEMPAPRLQRRERRELEAGIAQLTQSLPNLTRLQRDSKVRVAADQIASVRF